jgi:uncharacterized protein (TIGR02453 family)
MARFPGFPPEAITFFRGLKRNNRRDWFQPRKQVFEDYVKTPMIALINEINGALVKFAPDYCTEPGKAIYRFYRDTRFSKDKTPYKDHIAASFNKRGMPRHRSAGFYFSVSAAEIEVAAGIYMPEREELLAVRNHLASRPEEFRRLLADSSLRRLMGDLQGDTLSRVPKGFASSHPAEDLLRRKQWYHFVTLDGTLAAAPALSRELISRFRASLPIVEFLNAAFESRSRRVPGE